MTTQRKAEVFSASCGAGRRVIDASPRAAGLGQP